MSYLDLFKTLRQKLHPKADTPAGVASATALDTIKNALDQTDPGRKSQVLPQFADNVQKILGLLGVMSMGGAAMSGASGGGGTQGPAGPSPSQLPSSNTDTTTTNTSPSLTAAVKEDLENGLANGLAVLSETRGLVRVVQTLGDVIYNTKAFDTLSPDYQEIVSIGLQVFSANLDKYGLENYPVIQAPPIVVGNNVPSPIVEIPPDFFAQQFYPDQLDPNPGYVHYRSILGDDVYTKRTTDYPPFKDSNESVAFYLQEAFALELTQYVVKRNMKIHDIVSVIDAVLAKYIEKIHVVLIGTGATNPVINPSQPDDNSGNMLAQLLPILNDMIQQADSEHLPNSVLNQGLIKQLLNKHGDSSAKTKLMVNYAKQALMPGGSMSGLDSSGVSGLLKGLGAGS